ncbi:class I adenylate-forming enzyme family protein [Arthrobacter mobilis]|uniref:Acyl--CoA ligase n=1 Tax=Arthrobacter mobilis TaxID=2724944 RepID=A0A7X6K7N2_9MICC|nr:class I adenylate-forming enzyme family protein [Arthrobacter mobilis]NKX56678.1 acyl--CoA ligase [Arthrobacter mobilis]
MAAARPLKMALRDNEQVVTYGELDAAADRLAARLVEAGATTGTHVVLMADNSAGYLAAATAIWRAGSVLVTLYASSGPAEVSYVLENSGASLIVADQRAKAVIDELPDAPPVLVIDPAEVFAGAPSLVELAALPDPDPEKLALICYTSGSTARPKAVMHSHAGLLAGAEAYAAVWHITATERTIVCLPMAWAFGLVTTSMATLIRAGEVIVLPRTKPEMIIDAVSRLRGTFLAGVTTMFVKLTEYLDTLAERPDMGSLRLCISGGEPRNETVFARWTDFTGCPVHDVYAASECFPAVTYDPVQDPVPVLGSSGRVAPGSRMRVVDADGNDVPAGAVGEAQWKGPAHFLGYWKDPELTNKVLTEDGWYRTSDLVRVDQDGYVFVEGRISDMIIRGGSNVSPAEVEAVLAQHPSVRSVSVVGLPDLQYGEQVVAAIVPRGGDLPATDELRAFCAQRLAGYKIPTAFVALEAFPINARTEKVDRKALKQLLLQEGAVA